MASRALIFRRCRKHQRHVLILLDRKLADASNGYGFFRRRRTRGESGKTVPRGMRTPCGYDSEQHDYHESGSTDASWKPPFGSKYRVWLTPPGYGQRLGQM